MTPDDPRHGERAGYLAGCKDDCCTVANRRWAKQWRLNASRNGGRTTVPTEPVRRHVLMLQQTMSLCSIGEASGTSSSQLSRLLQGAHPRMWASTASALLAVQPGAKVGGHYVAAVGARRRVQALATLGYTFEELERRLNGYARSNLRMLAYGKRDWITSDTVTRIQAVYDELWDRPATGDTRVQRGAITKTKRRAQALGWVSPLAWDDDTIDDPNARPTGVDIDCVVVSVGPDEAKIQRRMAGDKTAKTRGPENFEVVRRLLAAGHSRRWIAQHTGLKVERYLPPQPEQVAA